MKGVVRVCGGGWHGAMVGVVVLVMLVYGCAGKHTTWAVVVIAHERIHKFQNTTPTQHNTSIIPLNTTPTQHLHYYTQHLHHYAQHPPRCMVHVRPSSAKTGQYHYDGTFVTRYEQAHSCCPCMPLMGGASTNSCCPRRKRRKNEVGCGATSWFVCWFVGFPWVPIIECVT